VTLLAAAGNGKALWYATRGTGVVALLLLTSALVLGVLTSARWRTPKLPRFVVGTLHRNLSLLAIAFVAAHVVTAVADHFAPIGFRDGVVPFASPYRPVWLGLGTVAFDLLLALVATSLLRARLGIRLWRAIHWLAYASWPVALLHSLGTGSDARFGWMSLVGIGSCLAVMLAIALRLARSAQPTGRRLAAAGATLAVPLALLAWYQNGPAHRGWAARAGTPVSLLRRHTSAGTSTIGAARSLPPMSFKSRLSGQLGQDGPDLNGLVRVNIVAALRGRVGGKLRITLWGEPTEGGGVALTASDVAFGADGTSLPYVGRVTGLAGNRVDARVTNADGNRVELSADLQLNRATGAVVGSLRGRATSS
jgi:sulfoxide reductase heme-binding subunit YedZ